MSTDKEKGLVEDFGRAKERLDEAKADKDAAQANYNELEEKLLKLMQDEGKEKTASYEGVGYASCLKPKIRVSVSKEDEYLLLCWLRDINRNDLVKKTVNNKSLASLATELLGKAQPLPKFISTFYQVSVRFYKAKE